MPAVTSEGIVYPVVGDNMAPLAGWFAQVASTTDAAIADVRADLTEAAYPAPLSITGAAVQAVTATSWADLPNAPAITLTLPKACWVNITHGGWIVATAGDTRVSSAVSGATTLDETTLEVGGSGSAWGQVLYVAGAVTAGGSGTRFVRLNAGVNTIKLRAYLTGGGTHQANYTTLQVAPIRWA